MDKRDLWNAYCNELAEKLSDAIEVEVDELIECKPSALEGAEEGDSSAQLYVGFLSLFGADRDISLATYWLNESSKQGNIDAIITMGMMNYCGSDDPGDDAHTKAGLAFLRAAELGSAFAEKMLMLIRSESKEHYERNKENFVSEDDLAEILRGQLDE
ncbi:MAG: sel1 repeat family protein [Aquipseudomonas alcaligenes]|uniref:Sel1 repeat family protein n=1 Tax=Aquipseudomonas alcaligenes TaxID=43263 RepID=A0A5C7VTN8_AQUAC|nr:MAG: sel1 repeat family protein [Pseudomonas alcaligenes]